LFLMQKALRILLTPTRMKDMMQKTQIIFRWLAIIDWRVCTPINLLWNPEFCILLQFVVLFFWQSQPLNLSVFFSCLLDLQSVNSLARIAVRSSWLDKLLPLCCRGCIYAGCFLNKTWRIGEGLEYRPFSYVKRAGFFHFLEIVTGWYLPLVRRSRLLKTGFFR
jgi:hypothetical protein